MLLCPEPLVTHEQFKRPKNLHSLSTFHDHLLFVYNCSFVGEVWPDRRQIIMWWKDKAWEVKSESLTASTTAFVLTSQAFGCEKLKFYFSDIPVFE